MDGDFLNSGSRTSNQRRDSTESSPRRESSGRQENAEAGDRKPESRMVAAGNNQEVGAEGYQDSEFAFPFQVYGLLEDAARLGFESIVSWVLDGEGFMVHDREAFTKRILPAYFDQTRYKSFQRQLNFYQFERTTAGPYKGKWITENSNSCILFCVRA